MFDADKGIKGSVIHHRPLTILQLKRLLLLFDELHFSQPKDERVFLEEGSICYQYAENNGKKILYSLDGFDLIERHKHLKSPEVPEDSVAFAKMLHYGQDYPAIIPTDILPYYKSQEFEKRELRLFDRFERAIDKGNIKLIDYKNSSFYKENSILLKIAFDFDATDAGSLESVQKLLLKEETRNSRRTEIIPTSPLVELKGFEWFPKVEYHSNFDSTVSKYDFENQFFSIIAKVNKKLALTGHYDLVPIFIDENIFNFYQYKIEKAKKSQDQNFRQGWNEYYDFKLAHLCNLLFISSSAFIDDQTLNKISIPQILAYKERCTDELYTLRKDLFQEISNIVRVETSTTDYVQIKNIVERKLVPDLQKYQNSQNNILGKVLQNTLRYSVGLSSAYVGYTQGLSPILISLLSGLSPLIADDSIQLVQKLREKKKRKYENTFSYFLNLTSK